MFPTGWQIHEGRRLIGMSQDALAKAAGIGLAVVVRAEKAVNTSVLTRRDLAAIQATLEAAGAEFIQENGGVGVQLRKAEEKDGKSRSPLH